MATKEAILAEGGRDGDALEDVNEYFNKSIIKDQFELAMRMVEVTRSTSEWHRRMTAENLGQSEQILNLANMPIGSEACIYKPPTQQEAIRRGRKVKHIEHYVDPETERERSVGTRISSIMDLRENALKEGEIIILKDDPEAKDWYCAEIRSIMVDRIEVNYLTTQAPALEDYGKCSEGADQNGEIG